tara:strand:- start:47 stop:814 length:768 start_codon:yes stop_codon:yes gene_type:complete
MKGFYWGKGTVRCSYCGGHNHNITTCKGVDSYADLALDKFAKMPNYIPTAHEHKALMELKRREERKAKLSKPRRQSRCSFCGSTGHKRPKCEHFKQLRSNLYAANKSWKRKLTEAINRIGIGIGSLVKFHEGNGPNDFVLGMVTKIDYANLNVFCSFAGTNKYQSNSTIEVLINNDIHKVSIKSLANTIGNDLLAADYWFLDYIDPSVVSPMPFEPDENWLNSEWDEVFNWFFNDINSDVVDNEGITRLIERWIT